MQNAGWASELGLREENQDSALCRADLGIFAVADGIGGEKGGAVASRVALEGLERFYESISEPAADALTVQGRLDLAVRLAHRAVVEKAVGPLARMGTTLVVVRVFEGHALIGHVGDSRAYRLRDGVLDQLTADHSMRSYWQTAVGSVRQLPPSLAEALTRALSPNVDPRPDFSLIEVEDGDVLMLCTDGVSKVLEPWRMALALSHPRASSAAASLTTDAMAAGGRDNATALVVHI